MHTKWHASCYLHTHHKKKHTNILVYTWQPKESFQLLLDEANNQKTRLDSLSERCEVLMEFSGHAPIRDRTVKLQGQYSVAVSQLQVRSTITSNRYHLK